MMDDHPEDSDRLVDREALRIVLVMVAVILGLFVVGVVWMLERLWAS